MLEAWRLLSNTFEYISSGKDVRSDIRVDNEMLLKGTEERARQFVIKIYNILSLYPVV